MTILSASQLRGSHPFLPHSWSLADPAAAAVRRLSPPAPVAPAPPPSGTYIRGTAWRIWAAHDTNDVPGEARPGFEALGGWLKNDGRELGKSRVWVG